MEGRRQLLNLYINMASYSSTRSISLKICKRLNNGFECSSKEEKVMTCIAFFCKIMRALRVDLYVIPQVMRAYIRNGYIKA